MLPQYQWAEYPVNFVNWDSFFKSTDVMILLYLRDKKESRYSDVLRNMGRTRGVLAAALRDLKARRLVDRMVEDTTPIQTKYRLTDKGIAVANSLVELKKQLASK